jgi:hypothetical protein
MRHALCLIALLLLGNAPPEADSVPDVLKPYIVNGELKTDDFGWMRGAFDGASEQEKADTEAIKIWLSDCMTQAKSAAVTELASIGFNNPVLDDVPIGPALCGSVATYNGMSQSTKSWAEFTDSEPKARLYFSIYKQGAEIARQHSAYEPKWGSEDAWDLLTATIMEQVYRSGHGWSNMEGNPKIDRALEPYFHAHLGNAMQKQDRKNTEMLKAMVQKSGWPSISIVGPRASGNAWLLVQHADHDPAFQLKALRLMEPLAARGEVSKRNYAYLYDRIMLKLNGKQRFGTQFGGCDGSAYKLRPLEDEANVEALRKSHDLEPLGDYKKSMVKSFGPCKEG